MKVLHISDLHFESLEKNEYSLQKIVDKIVVQCKEEKLDYIFFTGDLVFKGDDLNDFYAAQLLVLEELSQKLSVKKENVIFCCGNHDVHRGQELPLITEHLNKMTSEKDLEDFITSETRKMEYENSLLNIENFLKFQKDYFKDDFDGNNINDLYSIHSRETSDSKKIAIVSINTSWRCYDSDKDFGNLLFPNKLIENISLAIKNYDFKILLLHHPLAELRYWNKALIENKIYENFHVMLLGHIHKDVKSSIANNDEGLISSSSTAVLSNINEYEKMGFSLLDIDIELKNVAFKNYSIDSDNIVYKTNEYTLDIPVSGVKKEYIELRKKITRLYDIELENGNDLFLNNIHGKKGFFEKFSNPVLKNKSITEISDLKN